MLKALCALGLRIHEKRLWRVSDPGVCQHPIEVSPLEPSTENLSHLRSKRIRRTPRTQHHPRTGEQAALQRRVRHEHHVQLPDGVQHAVALRVVVRQAATRTHTRRQRSATQSAPPTGAHCAMRRREVQAGSSPIPICLSHTNTRTHLYCSWLYASGTPRSLRMRCAVRICSTLWLLTPTLLTSPASIRSASPADDTYELAHAHTKAVPPDVHLHGARGGAADPQATRRTPTGCGGASEENRAVVFGITGTCPVQTRQHGSEAAG